MRCAKKEIRCRRLSGNEVPKSVVEYVGMTLAKLSSSMWDGTVYARHLL